MPNSFAPEVIADRSGNWTRNGLRFPTEGEAQQWLDDLICRWTAVRDIRVVPSDDAPNYTINKCGQLTAIHETKTDTHADGNACVAH